jgi:HAD superfamily phosphoserine phosphatase-like hydrolase
MSARPQAAARGRFYLCDFDGTVALEDVGNRFFARFVPDRAAWQHVIDDWRGGRAGGREVLARECELAVVDEAEAARFVEGRAIDPAFPAFVDAVRAAGGEVAIASDGLLFYVRRILDAHGLGHVVARANHVRFAGGRLVPGFGSAAGEGCGRCGTCKGAVLAELARGHATTVFVGDGLSDRCGARAADVVYARDDLMTFCRATGLAARPFATFADVARAEGLTLSVSGPAR